MNNKVSLPSINDILNTRPTRPSLPPASHGHLQPLFPSAGVTAPHQPYTYPQTQYNYNPSAHVQSSPSNGQQPPHFFPLNPISHKSRSSSASSDGSNYHYQSSPHLYKVNSNEAGSSVGSTTPSKSPMFNRPEQVSGGSSPNVEASSGSNGSDKRKVRNNLPKETTYILLKWLNDHLNHPYPNSFEKNQLMMSTGLNQQQLSNWFINARRRKIKVLKEQQRLNV